MLRLVLHLHELGVAAVHEHDLLLLLLDDRLLLLQLGGRLLHQLLLLLLLLLGHCCGRCGGTSHQLLIVRAARVRQSGCVLVCDEVLASLLVERRSSLMKPLELLLTLQCRRIQTC